MSETQKEATNTLIREKRHLRNFDSLDLVKLWKLKDIQTIQIKSKRYDNRQTELKINKILAVTKTYDPMYDFEFKKMNDSLKRHFQEEYRNLTEKDFINNQLNNQPNADSRKVFITAYGRLILEHYYYNFKYDTDVNIKQDKDTIRKVKVNHFNITTTDLLKEIGEIFLDYQINSINTNTEHGDFTCIILKDGRQIFLIKKDAEIIEDYYKELIENAESLNDSTKVIYPYQK
ncbi:hypothetical protein ACE193_20835 [Bernardetia sp. OM2101]|uniref:hypothetical protein n=1 Tax=Bernardetia sp. OM2101 TaxID=3344876 RepID=UPI0035D0C854